MSVTIRDVAAEAGVTSVVVSRVLHNKAKAIRVSEQTAERVREAATRLGYRLNVSARNFRAQQTLSIGVLHGVGFNRPLFDRKSRYFASLMDGVVEGAFRHNYSVTLCPRLLGQSPEDAMSDGRFDGLVWYSGAFTDENRQMLMQCSVPLVIIHAPASLFENRYPAVICDNAQGIGLAVQHLAGLGHRNIAFALEGSSPSLESLIRLDAFKAHMGQNGLHATESNILRFGWDAEGLDSYLASPRHTAVITHNEELGSEFLIRAPKHGIYVPDDLSVVGFDSTGFCNELRPKLTAVNQPLVALGNAAIDLLVQAIKGDDQDAPREIVIPCSFDIRGSTKSINSE